MVQIRRNAMLLAFILAASAVNQAASEPLAASISATVTEGFSSLDGTISQGAQLSLGKLGASLTLHDNSAQGLDHGDLVLSYSAPLYRSAVGLVSANSQYNHSLFFNNSLTSNTILASLSYSRMAFGSVMTNTSIMHSRRRGLQGDKHSTTVLSISGLGGVGKTTISTKFSLGLNEDDGGNLDHFHGIDFSVSQPVAPNINISINASLKPDHLRKIHEGNAYDIWADQKSLSLSVGIVASKDTSVNFSVTHSQTKTEIFSERFSNSKNDWVVSVVKRF